MTQGIPAKISVQVPPDGTYKGHMSGLNVTFFHHGRNYYLETQGLAIKGINVKCRIEVSGGEFKVFVGDQTDDS